VIYCGKEAVQAVLAEEESARVGGNEEFSYFS